MRVVVVDDSQVFRTQLAAAIDACGCARVVGHARDGREALDRILEYTPDVVTLDVEMPIMDGIETLTELRKRALSPKVVMVSAHTQAGADLTMRALELGAHDFIAKPFGADRQINRERLLANVRQVLTSLAQPPALEAPPGPASTPIPTAMRPPTFSRPEIVAIGASTGGPSALTQIVARLPAALPVPVVIVQHMPAVFTRSLAASLAQKGPLRAIEATDGLVPAPGTVYVAPGGRHLRIVSASPGGRRIELTDDPPEGNCRPAVDYLFRSVAESYGAAALAVILTGMGKDGTQGLRELKRRGARVIGQDEKTCVVYGMPREAKAAGVVDAELPLDQIASAIVAAVKGQA